MCSVLCYLHTREPQVIHGDIKPGNIMLTPQGDICLIDFNISSAAGKNAPVWIEGYTKGYASPEQVDAFRFNQKEMDRSNWKSIDTRSDIYSLGATVYHMVTGQKPDMNERFCGRHQGNDENIRRFCRSCYEMPGTRPREKISVFPGTADRPSKYGKEGYALSFCCLENSGWNTEL